MAIKRELNFSGNISPFRDFGEGKVEFSNGMLFSEELPYARAFYAPATIGQNGGGDPRFDYIEKSLSTDEWFATDNAGALWTLGPGGSPTNQVVRRIAGGTIGNAHGLGFSRFTNASLIERHITVWASDSGALSYVETTNDPLSATTASLEGGPGTAASGIYQGIIEKFGSTWFGLGSANQNDPINVGELTHAVTATLPTQAMDSLELPEFGNVNFISETENFLVIGLENGWIYLWDAFSDTWNYRYKLDYEPQSATYKEGSCYIVAPPAIYKLRERNYGVGEVRKVAEFPARFRDDNQFNKFGVIHGGTDLWNNHLLIGVNLEDSDSSINSTGIWALGPLNSDNMGLSLLNEDGNDGDTSGTGTHAVHVDPETQAIFASSRATNGTLSILKFSRTSNRQVDTTMNLIWEDMERPEAEKQQVRVAVHTLPTASAASIGIGYRTDHSNGAFTEIPLEVENDVFRYGTADVDRSRHIQYQLTINASGASSPTIIGFYKHLEVEDPSDFGQ